MNKPLVLVVEDNAITAKMLQVTLQSSDYRVNVAHTAAAALRILDEDPPALILQDLLLPDMDGIDLLQSIRRSTVGASIPVVVCSGLFSKIEEARKADTAFSEYLFKPVDIGQLLQTVRRLAPILPARAVIPDIVHRLLVVDDDAVQLKLNTLQLRSAGYAVDGAGNAADAIAMAERTPPDAFLLDLLMPDCSGFELCVRIRQHPTLSAIPVVIASATYGVLGEEDQKLASRMGANALVPRTPSLDVVRTALTAALRDNNAPQVAADTNSLHSDFQTKLGVQLERQVALSSSLARRVALDSTLLAVTNGATALVNEHRELSEVVSDVLAHTLDAGGVSSGAVYLCDDRGAPALYAHLGFAEAQMQALENFFEHPEILSNVVRSGVAQHLNDDVCAVLGVPDLPTRSGMPAIVLEPLAVRGSVVGVLVIGASRFESMPEWVDTLRSIGSQLAQAIALSRTLEALRTSEDNFRHLFESNPFPMLVLDPSSLATLASNEAARAFFESNATDLHTTSIHTLIEDSDAREKALTYLRRDGELRARSSPLRYRRPNGGFSDVELFSRQVLFDGRTAHILIVHDITDREFLQQQVVQSQKMEAVGLLAGGIAHDFNNLLTVIKSCSSMLLEDLPPGDPRREDTLEISNAAERAAVLTRQLLAFSRRQVLAPKAVAVNNVVSDLERMLRRLIPTTIELELVLDPATGVVIVDAGQFEQVVVNLVVNARDAMPQGGLLQIATSNVALHPAPGKEDVPAGTFVLLKVSDTGTGMDAETQHRIFQPFFTTKPRGQGTGLGLSTVFGIVQQSGGHIDVKSALGKGTTFLIYFPRIGSDAHRPTPISTSSIGLPGNESILVVEDEEPVRRIVCRTLTSLGYKIIDARNGEEALALAETISEPPSLLLSDVVMPRMNGFELVNKLHAIWPNLRVLFMSGYADLPSGMAAPEHAAFIQKPFLPAELGIRVREVFDQEQ